MKVSLIEITDRPEKIIENCARISYDSFSKQTEDSYRKLLNTLLHNGHLSVFEHASAVFRISGISRACSHQLVRHRMASFIQRSQRYVREDGFEYVIPHSIERNPEALDMYRQTMESLQNQYQRFLDMGLKAEDARFILPNAACTELMMTSNFREWLHIIDLRVSRHAQWEIREMTTEIWKLLYEKAPIVFSMKYFEKWGTDSKYKQEIFESEISI